MASPTQWTWVWVDSSSWGWIGRPGVLQFMGSQRVVHDSATELNWIVPWMKSYEQPRHYVKNQRHYFANKVLSSQSYGFSSSHVRTWGLGHKGSWVPKNWCFWTVVIEKSLESLGLQGCQISQSQRKLLLNIHWKDWCWSCSSKTLATWCEEATHWKRPWCWKRLKAGGEGDDREWDGWAASLAQWTWVWASSGSWWWTGRPGMLQSMGLQRVGHDCGTELIWFEDLRLDLRMSKVWLSNFTHMECIPVCTAEDVY